MSIDKEGAFDPYHKWLGIPKAQRPPTHYQLLGLAQGETDAEVVEEAAIRQTTHLRAYQVGPHADDCSKLLNEVSTARQVLLNPQKRQEYDGKLAQLAAMRAAAGAAPVVESAFADLEAGVVPAAALKPRREAAKPSRLPAKAGKRPSSPRRFSNAVLLAGAGGVGLSIVGLTALVAVLMYPAPHPIAARPAPIAAGDPPKGQPQVAVDPGPKAAGNEVKPAVDPNPKNPAPLAAAATGFWPLGGFTLQSPPRNLVALADGRVFSGDRNLQVYDPSTNRVLPPMTFITGVRGIRFVTTPDGKTVYVSLPDVGKLSSFKFHGEQIASVQSPGEVSAMALSPDGATLVTGMADGHVHLWDAATLAGVRMGQFHGDHPVESVVFSRDGLLAASVSANRIMVWSIRDKRIVGSAVIDQAPTSVAITPDGQRLLAATSAGLQSATLKGNSWTLVKGSRDGILRIAFINDTTLAALRPDGPELYEWPTMTLLRHSPVVTRDCDVMSFTPDGKTLFVGLAGPRMLAFGTDSDVALKRYVGFERPAPPPPIMDGKTLVGDWKLQKDPKFYVDIDAKVRNEGGVTSAQLELRVGTTIAKAHVDSMRSVNGKMVGAVIADTPIPDHWKGLSQLELGPVIRDTLRVELRGVQTVAYGLFRREGVDVPTPKPPVTPKSDPTPVARVDVPDEAKIKEMTATVHDAYKLDYAKKSPAERAEFAERLLKVALESKNDSADRYVLCCEARDLGAAAGQWSIALEALEQIETGFKVDILPQKEAALAILVKSPLSKDAAMDAAETALQGVAEAIAADHLPLAAKFVSVAGAAAAKSQSVPHLGLFRKADAEVKLASSEADAVAKARETLKTMPNDPTANFTVGQYDALHRGDWESAIPHLAKGGDSELAEAARKELAAPKDGAGAQKIADEWWAAAEKMKPDSLWQRTALRNRAAHWYRQAAPQLTGLSHKFVNDRLKAIEDAPSPFQVSGSGIAPIKTLTGHKGAVTGLYLTLDGKRLFTGGLDGTFRSWDPKLGKNLTAFVVGQPLYGLGFSLSARSVVFQFKSGIKMVDTEKPTSERMQQNTTAVPGAFWVDEAFVAWLGPTDYRSMSAGWNTSAGHSMKISATQVAPSKLQLVTLGEETWVCARIANGPLGSPGTLTSKRFKTPFTDSIAAQFAALRPVVAVATPDRKIGIFDTQSNSVLTTLEGAENVSRCLAFSIDGNRLLSGGDDGYVHLWDVNAGKEVRRFATGSKGVTSILISPDGKQIVTGGSDGVIRVWSMPREKPATKGAG